MEVGHVLWFNDLKGFGMIAIEDGREIFFHYTSVAESGTQKRLSHGDQVSFDLFQTSLGWEASNIKIV